MDFAFETPWLALAAALVAAGAGVLLARYRKLPAFFFALAAAVLFLAGARPQAGAAEPPVIHALVVDVSGSMAARDADVATRADEVAALELPAGHSFRRYELSDALRLAGSARGLATDYVRLGDLMADESISGDVVLITDGRGSLSDLLRAVDGRRVILLRPPPARAPDAAILQFQAPAGVAVGGAFSIRVALRCDADAEVPWRLMAGDAVIAEGTSRVRADVPFAFTYTHVATDEGLLRLRLRLDLPEDREPRNDEAATDLLVGTRVDYLYCTPADAPADALLTALEADAGNRVTRTADLPASAEALRGVDVVVINNLSLAASGVAASQLQALADWVRAGGRLLMLGTDGAFGPGGYRGSPLEAVLPVRLRPEDAPPRRTLLLLDLSSSMDAIRLARLREGATRVLAAMDDDEQAAVVGFRERLVGEVRFRAAGDAGWVETINGLSAAGSTHIGTSLRQAALAMQGSEDSRIVMITDGEDTEGAGPAVFNEIAEMLRGNTRLDIVLTPGEAGPWPQWLADAMPARVWNVEGDNFDDLLETLDRVIAAADSDWVINEPTEVAGLATLLPRLVRTAPRDEPGVATALSTSQGYPVLARRQLLGRSVALCTDSWGGADQAALWADAAFVAELSVSLGFLAEGAGAPDLALNLLGDRPELTWVAAATPPDGDLETDIGPARRVAQGRWVIDGEVQDHAWIRVSHNGRHLQRVPVPALPPLELRHTGDDEAFFALAENAGLRVFSSLAGWRPQRHLAAVPERVELAWAAALLAVLLLLAGYALRR